MKRIIYLLIALIFLSLTFFIYFVTTHALQANFLFNHYHVLEIDFDTSESETLFDEVVQHLQTFSTENKINISRNLLRSANAVDIYSTNVREDDNIRLRSGTFPEGDYYVANQPLTEDDPHQVGQLFFPGLNFEVRLYDFEQIHQVGIGNRLFLTGNEEILALFMEEFSQYGQVVMLESFFGETSGILTLFTMLGFRYGGQLDLHLSQVRAMLVFIFVALVMIFYYISNNRKQLLLEQLWGRSDMQATLVFFREFSHFFLGLLGCLFGGMIIFTFAFHQEHFLSTYFMSLMVCTVIIFSLLMILASLGTVFAKKTNEIGLGIKGKSFFWQIKGGTFLLKTGVYLLLWLGIASSLSTYHTLQQQLSEFGNWEEAQNIFRTPLSPGRESTMHDLSAMRELNDRLSRFYQEMEQAHNAFTIYPYQVMHMEGVIINENYLDVNPIRGLNERGIKEQIVQDRYTVNLLVPEQFRQLENQIIEAYQDEFYFQKVYITNMFNEEIGEPLVEGIALEDLTVHIIYTEEGQSYFSFSKFNGGSNNTFYDPIAMILPIENVDTSVAGALVTNSLYFYDSSGNAYETILPAISESKVVEINSVISVYDEAHEDVILLQQQLFYQLVEVILIIIFSLLMLGLFIWAYYQTNSYQLNLKYLFGYSFWERHLVLILVGVFSNLIAGWLVILIFETNPSTVWLFIGGFFLIDLAMTKILSDYFSKKSVVRVLKGGVL